MMIWWRCESFNLDLMRCLITATSQKQLTILCWRWHWCHNTKSDHPAEFILRHFYFFLELRFRMFHPFSFMLEAIAPCFPLHPQHRRHDERGRTKGQLSFSLRLHPADVRAHMWRHIIAVSTSAVAWYRQNMGASACACVRNVVHRMRLWADLSHFSHVCAETMCAGAKRNDKEC